MRTPRFGIAGVALIAALLLAGNGLAEVFDGSPGP